METNYLQIFVTFVAMLCLFLFAINEMSKEIQAFVMDKIQQSKRISVLIKNKFFGLLFGLVITALINSSSAVTTITINLVNTGVISFADSLSVMLGSSIGTTITSFLVIFSKSTIVAVLLIVGYLLSSFGKKIKQLGKPVMYLGILMFALSTLSATISPLSDNESVMNFFSLISNPWLAFVVSVVLTTIVQSSSVTTGLIVVFAQSGILPSSLAIPMVLGANLGTTIPTVFISLDLSLFSKRASIANFITKLFSTLVFMVFLSSYTMLITSISADVAQQAAMSHLIFNIISSVIFLFLLKPIELLVIKLIPGNEEEILFETKYIDNDMTKTLNESVADIEKEIVHALENTKKIFKKAIQIYSNSSSSIVMEISKLETLNDYLDKEITGSILSLSRYKLPEKVATRSVMLVQISNIVEQLGDLGEDFSEVFQRMHKLDINSDDVQIKELTQAFSLLTAIFDMVEKEIKNPDKKSLMEIKEHEEELYKLIHVDYKQHIGKLESSDKYDGSIFVDAVSIIELSVSKLRDIRKLLLEQIKGN